MITTAAKLAERRDERFRLKELARAGDVVARERLLREFGTRVYFGAEAEALAPPVKVTVVRRNEAMASRWGETVDVSKDLAERFRLAIERSGKAKKDIAKEIRDPEGKPWDLWGFAPLLSGRKKRWGAHLIAAIEAWIAAVPEGAAEEGAAAPRPPRTPRPVRGLPALRDEVASPAPLPAPSIDVMPACAALAVCAGALGGLASDEERRRVLRALGVLTGVSAL